ncbi:MAG TPA: hypothetical protein PK273_06165, partial [Anaerolineaceae bacterium]|nr:hypothetical protein [Anaerolineaceae bacterium]
NGYADEGYAEKGFSHGTSSMPSLKSVIDYITPSHQNCGGFAQKLPYLTRVKIPLHVIIAANERKRRLFFS